MNTGHRHVVASAPTRIDLGGGWTDVPPFPEERGGFVCNIAIERRATVHLSAPGHPPGATEPVLAAALRRAVVQDASATVVNDFPIGAGLGGSSAAGVAMAAALARLTGAPVAAAALAEHSRTIEVTELGIAGGRQDHYAAAFGGVLGLTFDGRTHVERIPVPPVALAALHECLTVVYSGESRLSADTITAVLDAYARRERRVIAALDRMATLARGMRAALAAGDLGTLAALIDEHWVHQRTLHPKITTPRIDAIDAAVRSAGATGFKALGASGGGCVLVMAAAADAEAVRRAAARHGEVLSWRVAATGVRVEP